MIQCMMAIYVAKHTVSHSRTCHSHVCTLIVQYIIQISYIAFHQSWWGKMLAIEYVAKYKCTHIQYNTLTFNVLPPLQSHFESLSRTKVKRKRSAGETNGIKSENLIKRHAGILGLSACVTAFPYDVPKFIPEILMTLSSHVDDPQPIQVML